MHSRIHGQYRSMFCRIVNRVFMLGMLLNDGKARLYHICFVGGGSITFWCILVRVFLSYVCGLLFSCDALRLFSVLHAVIASTFIFCPPLDPSPIAVQRPPSYSPSPFLSPRQRLPFLRQLPYRPLMQLS